MTCTCTCHPSATITWGLGANGASATVPTWVHMADVPPPTDEEPWTGPDCRVGGCAREVGYIGDHRRDPADDERGTWLGCLLLVAALVAGYVLGRLVL